MCVYVYIYIYTHNIACKNNCVLLLRRTGVCHSLDCPGKTYSRHAALDLSAFAHGQSANGESVTQESLSLNFWEFPVNLGVAPLRLKNLLESKPLNFRSLVRGFTVTPHSRTALASTAAAGAGMWR